MLKISDFSKLSRISIRMLRYYDEKGLLKPVVTEENGYRYYKPEQLAITNQINYLKYLGFKTDKIMLILNTFKNQSEIKKYLSIQLTDLQLEQAELEKRINDLQMTLEKMDEEEILMNYKVETKTIVFNKMMCKRGIIPSYEKEGLLWEGMCSEVDKRNMKIKYVEPSISLAIFHDEGYKEKDVDVEIMVGVEGTYEDTENLKFKAFGPVNWYLLHIQEDMSISMKFLLN